MFFHGCETPTKGCWIETLSGCDAGALTLSSPVQEAIFSVLTPTGTRRRWSLLLPADLSSRADQMCPANLSLSSELGDVFNELSIKPMSPVGFAGVLDMSPARPRSSSKVQKASRLLYIIPSHLDPSVLCTSCRLLVSVSVFLSVGWQCCVVTGYTGVALPPSISVRLSARLRLPLSLHFDTTGPTFCRPVSPSVHSHVPVCLQLAWCFSDVTEVVWTYRSLLHPSPLEAVLSLLHPGGAGSVNVCVAAAVDGAPLPVNTAPVAMLSHLLSSSCRFFGVSAQIPQLLQKFEEVRTLWTLKGLLGRILSHKWVTLQEYTRLFLTIFSWF